MLVGGEAEGMEEAPGFTPSGLAGGGSRRGTASNPELLDATDDRPIADDGSEVRAFDVWQVDPFVRWILGLAGEAIPLEPPELVDAVREAARRVAVLHGGGAGA